MLEREKAAACCQLQARMGVATMKAVPLLSLLVVFRRGWRLNQIMVRAHRLGVAGIGRHRSLEHPNAPKRPKTEP